jgi:SAM-dependent methyltransferase
MDDRTTALTARISPRWTNPRAVAGFTSGGPNEVLVAWASRHAAASETGRRSWCLDIGSGAARNAVALAALGYRVVAADLSSPMLEGARTRLADSPVADNVHLVLAPMAPLPLADASVDLVVAHGIWNLAGSGAEFRLALAEAARVARPGAGLFVFTFSRRTLAADATPDPGESFVFSSWNGEPQCFHTEEALIAELAAVGFTRDTRGPLTEYNAPRQGDVRLSGMPPVIYEGTFVRR